MSRRGAGALLRRAAVRWLYAGELFRDTSTFTAAQRRVIVVLLVCFIAYIGIRQGVDRAYVSNPQPDVSPLADRLADRIDPNTADWTSLAVLPGLGEKRAKEIIAFRDRRRAAGEQQPFQRPADLGKIKGIGPSLVKQLEPYLLFPKG